MKVNSCNLCPHKEPAVLKSNVEQLGTKKHRFFIYIFPLLIRSPTKLTGLPTHQTPQKTPKKRKTLSKFFCIAIKIRPVVYTS